MYLARKYKLWTLFYSAKEVPSHLSYFKTLSISLALGIEPVTSRSAVKRSTDWANAAAHKTKREIC